MQKEKKNGFIDLKFTVDFIEGQDYIIYLLEPAMGNLQTKDNQSHLEKHSQNSSFNSLFSSEESKQNHPAAISKSPLHFRKNSSKITLASKDLFSKTQLKQSHEGKAQEILGKELLSPIYSPSQKEENKKSRSLLIEFQQLKRKTENKRKRTLTKMKIDPQQFIVMRKNDIHQDYEFRQEIGCGSFGCSYVSVERKTSEKRAIKKIKKQNLDQSEFSSLMNQFQILKKMDHPSIIKLYEVYNDDQHLYVVMQLCEGGNLLDLLNNFTLKEEQVRNVMIQLLSAVSYMHSQNILHKDIKLQNIVVVNPVTKENLHKIQIKLIDFGLSIDLEHQTLCGDEHLTGTLLYSPPESILGTVQLSWDIWSCGIVCYMMATDQLPYKYNMDQSSLLKFIQKGNVSRKPLQSLPKEMKLFIMSLLQKSYKFRSNAQHTLRDNWIKKGFKAETMSREKRRKTVITLQKYEARNSLISLIESYLVSKKITQSERQQLAQAFKAIDSNKNGVIEIQQLQKFYLESSQFCTPEDFQILMSSLDKNKSGKVDFNQFLVAMCSKQKLFQRELLLEAFDFLDKNKSGSLNIKQVREILKGAQNEQIQLIFQKLDIDKNGRISKEQFISYFEKIVQQ